MIWSHVKAVNEEIMRQDDSSCGKKNSIDGKRVTRLGTCLLPTSYYLNLEMQEFVSLHYTDYFNQQDLVMGLACVSATNI